MRFLKWTPLPFYVAGVIFLFAGIGHAQATKTEVVQKDGGWQLIRNGTPYLIKGAGGGASHETLKSIGGNSVRTWGVDGLDAQLAEANKLGLSVCVGIWLGQERSGFSYDSLEQVAKQLVMARAAIEKYKDNPAVLMWGLGNEMEGYKEGANPKIWKAVQDIAAMAHKVDPNHPTMTVIAEIGGRRVQSIHQYCPDIDIVGINTYAGVGSIPARYRAAGGTKPYVVTETGPPGTWEVGKTPWDKVIEMTSTQKGDFYKRGWMDAVASQQGLALGEYCFTWGSKRESTETWFGMFLPDGSKLEAVDAMEKLWTGQAPANRCPKIEPIALSGSPKIQPGATLTASVKVSDPDSDSVKLQWVLHREPDKYGTGGDKEDETATFPDAISQATDHSVEVKMPEKLGPYRLYVYARDGKGSAATANVPLLVTADAPTESTVETSATEPAGATEGAADAKITKATLPYTLYGDDMKDPPVYASSGWMGNYQQIAFDEKNATDPHSGKTCIKATYKAGDNFAGIVWQSPANDWGDQAGGLNLTGAKKLTFWARGENGNEKVEFKFGVLDKGKKFPDSDSGSATETLTKKWKQYSIDLAGKDLSDIKTGFCWVLAGQGQPVTFYLDDIEYK